MVIRDEYIPSFFLQMVLDSAATPVFMIIIPLLIVFGILHYFDVVVAIQICIFIKPLLL